MAKKLIYSGFDFDVESNELFLEGNIRPQRLLLITNVTRGTILYNFADPTLGFSEFLYDAFADKTAYKLKFDMLEAGFEQTDTLQIFIEENHPKIEFSEAYMDPVNKLRVSNPENLIDTDFEYGLQGTKWETVQTVQNIPTIFSSGGDVPIEGLESIVSTENSKVIRVTLEIPTDLKVGDPIIVQGVTLNLAEGAFLVTGAPSQTEFFYEIDQIAPRTEILSGSYTTIIKAKFFVGSSLLLDESQGLGITTDGLDPSTITVTTPEVHGLNPRTKVYLRNTVGPKILSIQDPTAIAPDGRPVIDLEPGLEQITEIDSTLQTNRLGFLEFPVVTWDTQSTYSLYLAASDFDTVANTVTWQNHGFADNYCLVFQAQDRGQVLGSLQDGRVYYVKVVNSDSIQLCEDYGTLASVVNLTALDTTKGHPRLSLCYKVEARNNLERRTAFFTRNNVVNTNGIQRAESSINNSSTRNFTVNTNTTYGAGRVPWQMILSRIDFASSNTTFNTQTVTAFFGRNSPPGVGVVSVGFGGRGVRVGTDFPNLDISTALFEGNGGTFNGLLTTVGNYYFTIQLVVPAALITRNKAGTATNSWQYRLYFTGQHRPANLNFNHSGSDLLGNQFGLGGTAPQRVIAFQSRTPGSAFNTTLDTYSNLPNQRDNGRFGTGSPKYGSTVTSTNDLGILITNFNDAGLQSFIGNNTHVYYILVDILPANFRNSIYKPAHGFSNNDIAEVTVTNFTTSNRFAFVDSSGSAVPINSETFQAKVTVINSELFRLEPTQAPNTDDICNYPNLFEVSVLKINPFFNTVFVAAHKVTSITDGTIILAPGSVAPDPLNEVDTFRIARRNDNRIFFKLTSGAAASGVTAPSGNTSVAATDYDVNIQDPLGLDPTVATITKVEYRGNLRNADQFLVLEFYASNGVDIESRFTIANVAPKANTAQFLTASNFVPKDISNILRLAGGKRGFKIRVSPTSSVNRVVAGMTNFYEVRFTVSASSEDIILTTTGSGEFFIRLAGQSGAYDGTYNITSVPGEGSGKTFLISAPFEIPKRQYDIPAVQVDTANDVIQTSTTGAEHNLILGEAIEYDSNGGVTILPTGVTEIFVIPTSPTAFRLATSKLDAEAGNFIQLSLPDSVSTFTTSNIIKGSRGVGSLSGVVNTSTILGQDTRFLSEFKEGDVLFTFAGGRMRSFTITLVPSDVELFINEVIPANFTDQPYFLKTTVNLRPDGFNLHKPFDGGVDITAGTSPNSKIVRQSRKYFRYQSGKGIQNSFAINFSPAKLLAKLTYDDATNEITAFAQEPHNLSVNDRITIQGAEVTVGTNFYNDTFLVKRVINSFDYVVESNGPIEEFVASGFAEYYREEWRDSFVRSGMFDDQNGFFYEYDGVDIACVRRSSTLQLSGIVNVTKNSQVVEGIDTSFNGQLVPSDKVVIRGQSYKVISIDSDSRLVVQPPYRGASATRVKLTKTVDTKVLRKDWSIDQADGLGPSGFIFDPHKIQMAYADYSWYGAGKVRFGMKDREGHVFYFHEFIHNNILNESYFRSGNLPARYEIENGDDPTSAPTLFHFGTSVMMDGRFDDDGAFKFSAVSKPFVFANGATGTFTSGGVSQFEQITVRGKRVFVYSIPVTEAAALSVQQGQLIRDTVSGFLPTDTTITQVKVLGAESRIFTSFPALSVFPDPVNFANIQANTSFTFGELTPTDLTAPIPLVSIRLAPSVDSSLVGFLGEREIVNRMSTLLDSISVTSNKEVDVFLVLNGQPSKLFFDNIGTPSLSQFIDHDTGNTIAGGVTLYSTKVSPGNTTDIDLSGLIDLGNSILGGDGIFPSGPDLLTLVAQPTNTVGISATQPYIVSGKLSWSESQA